MRTLPTLEATCGRCASTFSHPSLGDFAYGEFVLCSADGRSYAVVDGTTPLARRVGATLTGAGNGALWTALAEVADPIEGQALTASIRCPACSSADLESWGGRVTGTREVPAATFEAFARRPAR